MTIAGERGIGRGTSASNRFNVRAPEPPKVPEPAKPPEPQKPPEPLLFRCAREACGWRMSKWRSMCTNCGVFNTVIAIDVNSFAQTFIQDGRPATTSGAISSAADSPVGRSTEHLKAYQFQKKSPSIEAKAEAPSESNAAIVPVQSVAESMAESTIESSSESDPERPRSKRARDLKIVERMRMSTGFIWLDLFFGGGGPIDGHLIMVAAQPGTGKSSLLTEVIAAMSSIHKENALYAAGEESEDEVMLRAREGSKEVESGVFGRWPGSIDFFCVYESMSPEEIVAEIDRRGARFIVIDSAGSSDSDQTSAGDGAQVTHAAKVYFKRAQATGEHKGKHKCVIFLVMHCTKEGDLAGPNKAVHEASFGVMMEHVDPTTLFVSEEPTSTVRLRVYKKSRGSSNKRKCYFDWDESIGRLVERPLGTDGVPLGSLVVTKDKKPVKPADPKPTVPDLNLPALPKMSPSGPSETPLDSSLTSR